MQGLVIDGCREVVEGGKFKNGSRFFILSTSQKLMLGSEFELMFPVKYKT